MDDFPIFFREEGKLNWLKQKLHKINKMNGNDYLLCNMEAKTHLVISSKIFSRPENWKCFQFYGLDMFFLEN